MIIRDEEKECSQVIEGIKRKGLAYGEKASMTKFVMEEGSVLPSHSHPHEQVGYLLSGEIILRIGETEHLLKSADSWAIPGGVEHSARVLKRAEALEIFIPVREDYIE